jgi:hypothetical protein
MASAASNKRPTASRSQIQRKVTSDTTISSATSSSTTDLSLPSNSQSSTFNLNDTGIDSVDGSSSPKVPVWVDGPLVQSPGMIQEQSEGSDIQDSSQSSVLAYSQPLARPQKPSFARPRPVPITALAPVTVPAGSEDNPPQSPTSSARWANLRHIVRSHHTQQSTSSSTQSGYHTAQSSQSSTTPSRPTTPKPSRFPRLRQVVEHVGAQMSTSGTTTSGVRKFSDDILHACHAARFTTSAGRQASREASAASSFLPFVTPGSIPPLRRPQSQQSMTTVASRVVSKPTLQYLYSVLLSQSQTQTQHQHQLARTGVLPHEMLVLSTLLFPFVTETGKGSSGAGSSTDGGDSEEMWFSVEILGLLLQAWPSVTPEVSLHLSVSLL